MEQTNRLTDSFIRTLRRSGKARKFYDGDGRYLLLASSGALGWRLKYRIAGREKLISLGSYPEVRLAEARDLRHDARELIAQGTDPSDVRKAAKFAASNTIEQVAEEYVKQREGSLAKRTVDKVRWQLREFVNPTLGNQPINLEKITGGAWIFPALGPKKRCISENTLGAALRTVTKTSFARCNNHSERIKKPARMMQKWSDRLDTLKAAKVNRVA